MKTKYLSIVAIAAALSVPVLANAQAVNGSLTRAEVKAQLVQVEQAGYNNTQDRLFYPQDIQAAEHRAYGNNAIVNGSSGSSVSGTSASGYGNPAYGAGSHVTSSVGAPNSSSTMWNTGTKASWPINSGAN